MKEISEIADLPSCPALYALYGGVGRNLYVAYVGIADSLKRRAVQHLLNRNSSIATGRWPGLLLPISFRDSFHMASRILEYPALLLTGCSRFGYD